MKKAEAEQQIVMAFDKWSSKQGMVQFKATGNDAFLFYNLLNKDRSPLLSFPYKGNRWQIVHAWLFRARRVTD